MIGKRLQKVASLLAAFHGAVVAQMQGAFTDGPVSWRGALRRAVVVGDSHLFTDTFLGC